MRLFLAFFYARARNLLLSHLIASRRSSRLCLLLMAKLSSQSGITLLKTQTLLFFSDESDDAAHISKIYFFFDSTSPLMDRPGETTHNDNGARRGEKHYEKFWIFFIVVRCFECLKMFFYMPREKESEKLWSLGPKERRVVRMWVKLIHGMEPIFGGYKNLILIAAVSLCGFFRFSSLWPNKTYDIEKCLSQEFMGKVEILTCDSYWTRLRVCWTLPQKSQGSLRQVLLGGFFGAAQSGMCVQCVKRKERVKKVSHVNCEIIRVFQLEIT